MQLAFWNFPPSECLQVAAQSLGIQSETQSFSTCTELLYQKQVDLALIPVTVALQLTDHLDIVPGGVVSSWKYPFTSIELHQDLHRMKTIGSSPQHPLEEFMTIVIMKEHYGQQLEVVKDQSSDVALIHRERPSEQEVGLDRLDLGQEWYEMAQYPMVWGVYCCLKGSPIDALTQIVLQLTREAEATAHQFTCKSSLPAETFFREHLRLRMDQISIASMTAIRDYMYYHGIMEDLSPLPLSVLGDLEHTTDWGHDTGFLSEAIS